MRRRSDHCPGYSRWSVAPCHPNRWPYALPCHRACASMVSSCWAHRVQWDLAIWFASPCNEASQPTRDYSFR